MIKLKAETADDLQIISAMMQDAAVKIGDIAFLPSTRRFAFVCNRYRWEKEGKSVVSGRGNRRVRSAVRIESVLAAGYKNLAPQLRSDVISILNLQLISDDKTGPYLIINCAGDGTIRLQIECLEIYLEDLGPDWHTRNRPDHGQEIMSPDADGSVAAPKDVRFLDD